MTITADDPFRDRSTISRAGFIAALRDNDANPGLFAERDAGAYWDECRRWAIDPNFILAMAWHESLFLTTGTAVETKSFGNTRAPSFGAIPIDLVAGRSGDFPAWASYLDGLASTTARLASSVWPVGAPYGERVSIREVFDHPSGLVWAPSSDANDPTSYLGSVVDSMNHWTDQDAEAVTQTAIETPAVYQDYLTVNYTDGRAGHPVNAIILHITAGPNAASAIGWFKNPSSQVSAHYVIDRDGTITALVREDSTAWVNGVVEHPNTDIPVVREWVEARINPNLETIGIEVAGYSSMQPSGDPALDGYSEAQFGALAVLLPALAARREVALNAEETFGHCEISGTQRANCPGLSAAEWDRIYAMAAAEADGGPYATPDEAYDAWCATWDDQVIWAGQIVGKAHWYARQPQELARTSGNRLLAYDGAYAQDATGWSLDEWQEASWAGGQLTIWGREPPAPPAPEPGPVGAAWPINPGDGLTDAAPAVVFRWGKDAPTADLALEQSDGVRIFELTAHPTTEFGPVLLAHETTYRWRVRGRDGERVSDWTEATFATAAKDEPRPPPEPKPPGYQYPPVVKDNPADPTGDTWLHTSDNRVDWGVSGSWRPDAAGGGGPWPDQGQWLSDDHPGNADPDATWSERRKLARRLSQHPALCEALLRTGWFDRLPDDVEVCSTRWADGAATDYGGECERMPAHVKAWADRLIGLGNAIAAPAPTIWQALLARGLPEAEARRVSQVYRCLRERVVSLDELAGCR